MCEYRGKKTHGVIRCHKSASIALMSLVDVFLTIYQHGLFTRSPDVKLFLSIDGHFS